MITAVPFQWRTILYGFRTAKYGTPHLSWMLPSSERYMIITPRLTFIIKEAGTSRCTKRLSWRAMWTHENLFCWAAATPGATFLEKKTRFWPALLHVVKHSWFPWLAGESKFLASCSENLQVCRQRRRQFRRPFFFFSNVTVISGQNLPSRGPNIPSSFLFCWDFMIFSCRSTRSDSKHKSGSGHVCFVRWSVIFNSSKGTGDRRLSPNIVVFFFCPSIRSNEHSSSLRGCSRIEQIWDLPKNEEWCWKKYLCCSSKICAFSPVSFVKRTGEAREPDACRRHSRKIVRSLGVVLSFRKN